MRELNLNCPVSDRTFTFQFFFTLREQATVEASSRRYLPTSYLE